MFLISLEMTPLRCYSLPMFFRLIGYRWGAAEQLPKYKAQIQVTVNLVHIADQTNYYRFWAQTLHDAQQQMRLLGPRDSEGRHAARCLVQAGIMENLQHGIVPGSTQRVPQLSNWTSTAHITRGELRYRAIYDYPRWVNIHVHPRYMIAEWQRFTGCLIAHERGHLRESIPLLREYKSQFESLRIASSGSSAQAAERAARRDLVIQIRELYSQLAFRCERTNQDYDHRTRHGRTQAARLRVQRTVRRARR